MRIVVIAATLALISPALTACNGDDDGDRTPTASGQRTATRTAEPTATQSLEDEVSEAYLEYWDAYSAALLELDISLVEPFAAGERLEEIREEIEEFRSQGVALRTVVEHDFVVVDVSETTATVSDEIVNNSFFVDPVTKEPPTAEGSGEMFTDTYHLERVGDRWIVVEGNRVREQ
jgi:hypothetical protein